MVDIMNVSESDARDLACRAPQSCFSDCPAHRGCTPGQAALKSQTKCLQCNLQCESEWSNTFHFFYAMS